MDSEISPPLHCVPPNICRRSPSRWPWAGLGRGQRAASLPCGCEGSHVGPCGWAHASSCVFLCGGRPGCGAETAEEEAPAAWHRPRTQFKVMVLISGSGLGSSPEQTIVTQPRYKHQKRLFIEAACRHSHSNFPEKPGVRAAQGSGSTSGGARVSWPAPGTRGLVNAQRNQGS